jgi:hypothetical protein
VVPGFNSPLEAALALGGGGAALCVLAGALGIAWLSRRRKRAEAAAAAARRAVVAARRPHSPHAGPLRGAAGASLLPGYAFERASPLRRGASGRASAWTVQYESPLRGQAASSPLRGGSPQRLASSHRAPLPAGAGRGSGGAGGGRRWASNPLSPRSVREADARAVWAEGSQL